jgi:tetratricopeptide (TPR) repeat protein
MDQGRSSVAKEKPARRQPEASAQEPPATGTLLRRLTSLLPRLKGLPGWLRANPVRGSLALGGSSIAIIGLVLALTLVLRPAARPTYIRQLAQAFSAFEKGNRVTARRLAARLLTDATAGYGEHGGAYFILGAITLRDAEEQINPSKRQLLALIAARYLEEARNRGLPPTREREGLWMLGRALHSAGRHARSISILREALELAPQEASAIHALLADCYLNLQPPKLAEALEHSRQYLAMPGLSPRALDGARLVEARILLTQRDITAAESTVSLIEPTSPVYAEAMILHGRISLAKLKASTGQPAPDQLTIIATLQDQLRRLLAREGLATSISAQAQLLIGQLYEQQGDARAAIAQFDRIRRLYFGQPEALAATIFHGDLVRQDNPPEAVALYKRALAQLAGSDEAYNNTWLPADEFRSRLSAAMDDLAERGFFGEALDLAENLVSPFSNLLAVERQAQIHRSWARQLEARAATERFPQAEGTEAEARQHRRQAGALWRKLADLRIASRHYLDDLASAAEDFRRGHGFEQAAVVYRDLLKQEPQLGRPEALVGLGESLLALGKIDEALTVLGRCSETAPKHPASYHARLLTSLALQEQGKLPEAQELLIDNLYRFSLAPQSTDWRDSLFALGALLYRQAQELETRSRVTGVDRLDAESRRTGLALLEQSHSAFEEAIRTLTEAVERYPTAPQAIEARYRIAEAYRHSAKLPRKRIQSVTIETSRALLSRQMAEHLLAAIDGYSSLITHLSDQQDTQRWPTEAAILRNCYFGRADALFDLGRYVEAIQAYSAATNRYQHDPESLEAYVQIASCHRRLGRLSEARGTLEQARVVLQRIRPDADFVRTTRLGRQDWVQLLDWLRTL